MHKMVDTQLVQGFSFFFFRKAHGNKYGKKTSTATQQRNKQRTLILDC